jgi:hypothetical protein
MMEGGRLFGEEQMILHTSRTLDTTLDVARPAFQRAKEHGLQAFHASGREVIVAPDGSRWSMKSEQGAYGFGASLAICDEAWDYSPATVTEGIQPTMMERLCPQLLIVSTAHRRATKLVPERRLAALAELEEPRRRLIVEWSCEARFDDDLEEAARVASPIWDRARARHVADSVTDARQSIEVPGEIPPLDMWASQYLNDWGSAKLLGRARGEPIVEPDVWENAAAVAEGPVAVAAVEDYFGKSYGVGWVRTDPDTLDVVVGGQVVADKPSLRALLEQLDPQELLAGVTLYLDAVFDGFSAQKVGSRETRPALAELRRGVAARRVFHDGSQDLADQVAQARVEHRDGGMAITSGRSDVIRPAAWCVGHIEASRRQSPAVF